MACRLVSGSRETAGQGPRVKWFGPDAAPAQAHLRARASHQGEQQQGGAHHWSPRFLVREVPRPALLPSAIWGEVGSSGAGVGEHLCSSC